MKKSIFFIFLFVVIVFFILPVNSRNITFDNEGNIYVDGLLDKNACIFQIYSSSLDNNTPNYQIIPIVDKKTINSGDNFTISFQISGKGKIVSNRLLVYFPTELLKDNPIYYNYIEETEKDGNFFGVIWYDKYPQISVGDKNGTYTSLPAYIFKQFSPNDTIIFGEKTINGHRPYSIKTNSRNNAPPGDYIIKINFVYSDGTSWYNSQDEVVIHVRDWYESIYIYLLIGIGLVFLGIIIDKLIIDKLWIRFGKNKNRLDYSKNQKKDDKDTEKKNVNQT